MLRKIFILFLLVSTMQMSELFAQKINGHDYVDLGLSVNWSAYNVGANSGNECGVKLVPSSASSQWGSDWRLPTLNEMKELVEKCKWSFDSQSMSYKVIGPNGNSIKIYLEPILNIFKLDVDGYISLPTSTQKDNEHRYIIFIASSEAPNEKSIYAHSVGSLDYIRLVCNKQTSSTVTSNSVNSQTRQSFPTSGKCGTNITWTLKNGVLMLKGTGATYQNLYGIVKNPEDVTSIEVGEGITKLSIATFHGLFNVKSVKLPTSLKIIEQFSFENCSSLENINIPSGLSQIEYSAFRNCSNIKAVNIPASVKEIGYKAFYGCEKAMFTVDSKNPFYDSRDNCNAIILTKQNKLLFGSVHTKIPSSIRHLFNECFAENMQICELIIPESVDTIDSDAIKGCNNLRKITFCGAGQVLGELDMRNLVNLKEIHCLNNIPPIISVRYEPDGFAMYCPKGGKEVYNLAIGGNVNIVESNNLPQATTSGRCGTNINWTLENGILTLTGRGNTCNYIWNEAIFGQDVTEIRVEEGITGLGNYFFHGSKSLKKVTLPASLTTIGKNAFFFCEELEEINLPERINSISEYVLSLCSKLKSLHIPSGIVSLGHRAFRGNANATLTVSADNPVYESPAGSNAIVEKATKKLVLGSSKTIIPEDVEIIADQVFDRCTFDELVIPASVREIESDSPFPNSPQISSLVVHSLAITGKIYTAEHYHLKTQNPPKLSFGLNKSKNKHFYVPKGCLSSYLEDSFYKTQRYLVEEDEDGNVVKASRVEKNSSPGGFLLRQYESQRTIKDSKK